MKLLHTIHHPSRVHDVKFCKRVSGEEGEILLVGAEDKKLSVYDIHLENASAPPTIIAHMVGHDNRYLFLNKIFPSTPFYPLKILFLQSQSLPNVGNRTSTFL